MKKTTLIAAAMTAGLAGCMVPPREVTVMPQADYTAEHFRRTVTIRDDRLDSQATISTELGARYPGRMGVVWDDNFLRAFIDKRTGAATFQLYQVVFYRGRQWNHYSGASFDTINGPIDALTTQVAHDVSCSGRSGGECLFSESIVFNVEERVLRDIEAAQALGRFGRWEFKLRAQSGAEYPDALLSAEISGLLAAVDEYRAKNGLAGLSPNMIEAARPAAP